MTDEFKQVRPSMRPGAGPVAEESPRERAARKAAELRAHRNGEMDDGTDAFFAGGAIPGAEPRYWWPATYRTVSSA